jgi:glutamate/tyrosine decarboxylase-like PLP-dependent enzyme
MSNIAGLLAARAAKVPWDVNASGLAAGPAHKLRLYASQEAHSWIERASEMLGFGCAAVRRVPVDAQHGMDYRALHRFLQEDTDAGLLPFLVIGTAGTLQTGAVDPLLDLASTCQAYKLWFHVDGTYGGCATLLLNQPDAVAVPEDLRGISVADSLALDAHRWLYAPPDTSFLLMRDPDLSWYHGSLDNGRSHVHNDRDEDGAAWLSTNGFRALNVWLALRQVGRKGYVEMLSADIELARILSQLVREQSELQPGTQGLSITTFRYVPPGLTNGDPELERYLERLNRRLLARLRQSSEALISGVTVSGIFMLRACIVNFRTSLEDIEALVNSVVRLGRDVDAELRSTWM